jgi:hypothetical protein
LYKIREFYQSSLRGKSIREHLQADASLQSQPLKLGRLILTSSQEMTFEDERYFSTLSP